VGEGDTVLLASSLIPGNESAIYRLINALTKLGANVVHKGNAKVHVSGHASAGELAYCYNVIKPRNVMPVHGEFRHLIANGDIAIRTGVDPKRVIIGEDGTTVDLQNGIAAISGKVDAGFVFVDGQTVGGATEETLEDRRRLGEEGLITVLAIVDPDTARLAEDPEFFVRGFVHEPDNFTAAVQAVEKALSTLPRKHTVPQVESLIETTVERWMQRTYRRKPVVTAIVVDA
jgi:ribonuclease J